MDYGNAREVVSTHNFPERSSVQPGGVVGFRSPLFGSGMFFLTPRCHELGSFFICDAASSYSSDTMRELRAESILGSGGDKLGVPRSTAQAYAALPVHRSTS